MLTYLSFALVIASFTVNQDSATPPVVDKSPRIQVGATTFTADRVLFKSAEGAQAGQFTCTLEGHAKLILFTGDIEITADKIQFEMGGEHPAGPISCTGACTWKQDDDSGEILSGDNLTLGKDGLCITGNASIQYGSDQNKTVLTGDSLMVRDGAYEFSGKVKLRHGQ